MPRRVLPPAPLPVLMPTLMRSALFLLALMGVTAPAQAYIDPNAGGLLFQLLAPVFAALVGAWLFLRRWIAEQCRGLWHRLRRRLSRQLTGNPEP